MGRAGLSAFAVRRNDSRRGGVNRLGRLCLLLATTAFRLNSLIGARVV